MDSDSKLLQKVKAYYHLTHLPIHRSFERDGIVRIYYLYWSRNHIFPPKGYDLPYDISQVREIVKISGGALTDLPEEIDYIRNLYGLLIFNEIHGRDLVRQILSRFPGLQMLSYSNYPDLQLEVFPPEITELTELKYLSVEGHKIPDLPASIGNLRYLEILKLRENAISTIPRTIGMLQELEELDLSKNQITAIPEEIGQLRSIRQLQFGSNRISRIPETIAELTNLEYLSLYDNPLKTGLEYLCDLPNLKSVSFDGKYINQFPLDMPDHANFRIRVSNPDDFMRKHHLTDTSNITFV